MANTLKFGAGQWATKEGSTLAYNDESDNFKPLPFDFTRASSGTVVNKAGLIETVGNGIPRIDFLGNTQGALKLEPQRTNLITQSEAFGDSYWTKSGSTIQADPSTAGSELVTNGDFSTDSDWTKQTGWSISGGSANYDFATNSKYIRQTLLNGGFVSGKNYQVNFEITSGVAYLNVKSNAETLESTALYSIGSYSIYVTASANGSDLLIYGINTQGSAFSIDNVSVKEVQGFTSPDGTTNAYKLVEDSTNSSHRIEQTLSAISGVTYTQSVFAKKGERSLLQLDGKNGICGTANVDFDLENGTFTENNGAIGSIELIGNSFYKCTFTFTAVATVTNSMFISLGVYQGDGTSGVYIYGAQLEQGSYATSYIPTQGSAVTRLRDLCDTQNLSHVIGQTEGVIFYDAILVHKSTSTSEDLFELSIDDGSNQNIFFINNYNNTLVVGLNNGGSNQFSNNSFNPTEGARYKLAFAYKQNDFALYINGNQIATDSSGTVPTLNQITFGNYYNNQSILSNSVKVNNFQFYNTRLSNVELQALTS